MSITLIKKGWLRVCSADISRRHICLPHMLYGATQATTTSSSKKHVCFHPDIPRSPSHWHVCRHDGHPGFLDPGNWTFDLISCAWDVHGGRWTRYVVMMNLVTTNLELVNMVARSKEE